MEPDLEAVQSDVRRRVEGGGPAAEMAARVGAIARVSAIFGDPVEREGVTVIPVARAAFGFGGGSGGEGDQQGSGGGGGGAITPVGFIELSGGEARYRPLRDPRRTVLAAGVLGGLVAVGLRASRRGR